LARLNSKFNYLAQVEGSTIWKRLDTLDGFICGRERAIALREVNRLEGEALDEEIAYTKENLPAWEYKRLLAKKVERESTAVQLEKDFKLAEVELQDLKEIYAQLEAEVEHTRLKHADGTPYTNSEMYEVNAELEFVTMLAKDAQAEIITQGRPSKATVRNLMNCPLGVQLLRSIPNLIPEDLKIIDGLVASVTDLLSGNSDIRIINQFSKETTYRLDIKDNNESV
jgi:hypothetical protein